jgi:hypothetical protein
VKSLIGVEKNASFREVPKRDFATSLDIKITGNQRPFVVAGKFDIVVIDGERRPSYRSILETRHFCL